MIKANLPKGSGAKLEGLNRLDYRNVSQLPVHHNGEVHLSPAAGGFLFYVVLRLRGFSPDRVPKARVGECEPCGGGGVNLTDQIILLLIVIALFAVAYKCSEKLLKR